MEQSNSYIVDKVVEITISKLGNTNTPPNEEGGKCISEFMQVIYDKLVELYGND